MPPRYKYNCVAIEDKENGEWFIFHKLNKRIPKTIECYGSSYVGRGKTLDDAMDDAVANGIQRWDIQTPLEDLY